MKNLFLMFLVILVSLSGYAQDANKEDSIWKPKIEIGSNIIWLIKPDLQADISPHDDLWETHSGKTPMGNVFVRIHRPWGKKKGALRLRFEGAFYDFDSLESDSKAPDHDNAVWVNSAVGWEHYFVQKKHINLYGFIETGYGIFWGKKTFRDDVAYTGYDNEPHKAWVQSPDWWQHTVSLQSGVGISIQLLDHIRIGTELSFMAIYSHYHNDKAPTIDYDNNIPKTEGNLSYFTEKKSNLFSMRILPFQTINFSINF